MANCVRIHVRSSDEHGAINDDSKKTQFMFVVDLLKLRLIRDLRNALASELRLDASKFDVEICVGESVIEGHRPCATYLHIDDVVNLKIVLASHNKLRERSEYYFDAAEKNSHDYIPRSIAPSTATDPRVSAKIQESVYKISIPKLSVCAFPDVDGSCVAIDQNLFVTAAHVALPKQFPGERFIVDHNDPPNKFEFVVETWLEYPDIAFIKLKNPGNFRPDHCAPLGSQPPTLSEIVTLCGYAAGKDAEFQNPLASLTTTAVSFELVALKTWKDSIFTVCHEIANGYSGGGVFNAIGELCGLIVRVLKSKGTSATVCIGFDVIVREWDRIDPSRQACHLYPTT